jgi:hypothetical protein
LAVDPDAIGAVQVADHEISLLARDAAMAPRYPEGIEPRIARRMAADDQILIQGDIRTLIESDESC